MFTHVDPVVFKLGLGDDTWTFIRENSGYYGLDKFNNRRDFSSRDDIRHMCEYYLNIGWKVLPTGVMLF